MKKILITGASGFLGGHVYKLARERFETYAGFHDHVINEKGEWVQLDLTDAENLSLVIYKIKPDVVVHSAAISNLDLCEKDPEFAFKVNTKSTIHLAQLAKEMKFRLIFISTDMAFNGQSGMYKVSDNVSPISIYGRSKVNAEKAILDKQIDTVIIRSALIYGHPATGGSSFSMWIENQLVEKKPVALYHDQFRTPILVNNLARLIIELTESNVTGIIHGGGSERIDRYHFGLKMCELGGFDSSLLSTISMHQHNPPAPRPKDVSLDISNTLQQCNTPILDVEAGLAEMFKAN